MASTFASIHPPHHHHRTQVTQQQQQHGNKPQDHRSEPHGLSSCVRWTSPPSFSTSRERLSVLLDATNWPILSSYSPTAGPWNYHCTTPSPTEELPSPSTAVTTPSFDNHKNSLCECCNHNDVAPVYEMDGTDLHDREDWPLRGPRHRSVSLVRPGEQNIPEHLIRRAASTRVPRPSKNGNYAVHSATSNNHYPPYTQQQEEDDDPVISDIDDNSDQERDNNATRESGKMLSNGHVRAQNGTSRTPSATPPRSDISSSPVLASPQRHRDSTASNNRSAASPGPQQAHVSPTRRSIDQRSHSRQHSQTNGHSRAHSEQDLATNFSRNAYAHSDGEYETFSPIEPPPPLAPANTNPRRLSQHMSFSRDRVRYSWQSAQTEDDPNRPRIHIVKLISNTTSASAGFPGGEALSFSISPGGRRIAAYNSARLYVLQTAALPVGISQDYALKRRPLSVEVLDEGEVMAILVDVHTCNVYGLGHHRLRLRRTIKFDFPATCIALSPTGGLLAAGYEGGVEVFSLDPDALPTDRRAVRSQKMDRLMFSDDSSTLLGTTTRINASATVMISVPVFPSSSTGLPSHSELREAWCNELLHPENVRNSSHATFMRSKRMTTNDKVFAWNGLADTFGILNLHDMQYGNIDFPVVISPPLSTCGGLGAAIHSCPAIDEFGDTIAMIVNDRTIRLYLNPQGIVTPDMEPVEAHSIDHELDEGYGQPFSEVRWLSSSASLPAPANESLVAKGRLVITSPGGVMGGKFQNEEMFDDVEGGRIILFDFDPQFAGQPGQTFSLTLGSSPPQLLEEATVDVATEVAIVRRRTVNQSKSGTLNQRPIPLGRSASQFGGRQRGRLDGPGVGMGLGPPNSRRSVNIQPANASTEALTYLPDLTETQSVESGEPMDVVDEPYAQNAPRSHASLQRAATNAQRHRYQAIEERSQEQLGEHLNAEDRNLPLPEYTEEPNAPLPSRYRALAGLDAPTQSSYENKGETSTSDQGNESSDNDMYRPSTPPSAYRNNASRAPPAPETQEDEVSMLRPSPMSNRNNHQQGPGVSRAFSTATYASTPRLTGDWRAAMRAPINTQSTGYPSAQSGISDAVSPIQPPGDLGDSPQPSSVPSRANTFHTFQVPNGSRVPPHVQAIRQAAAAASTNTAASMFPSEHATDHVPHRQSSQPTGSVTHPVNQWSPPPTAQAQAQPPPTAQSVASQHIEQPPKRAQSVRNHLRKNNPRNPSLHEGSSSKKPKFSRRKSKSQQFHPPDFYADDGNDVRGQSRLETRSMFTTKIKREKRCVVM